MQSNLWLISATLILSVPILLSGCKNDARENADHDQQDQDGHEEAHDHDHEHEHVEGSHGGHLLELSGADRDYHAEWLHDDEHGVVTVYLLQEDKKTPLDHAPATITIEIRSGNSPKTYELPGTDSIDDVPVQSAYSITDPSLVTALQIVVENQEPLLHVNIGEKPATAKFEKHEHDEHGHHHH